ncbi:LarC family nickel insertion protein [Pararhodobacter sp. SW119]|uniref:LarC family nickel insertion protein n=1 Tax=Pararhodobacter sp. SW119 TaxID=2780075 RepID=UPI001AE05381|nr:LarC family nickel insertion protein [Pararhodobacter sp. SW119]
MSGDGAGGGDGLHLHFDPQGGVAGDMFVAALLHARPDLIDRVLADVAAVLPEAAGRAELSTVQKGGIDSRGFRLVRGPAEPRRGHETTYLGMRETIEGAALSPGTARHASAILHRIAEAESAIHAMPIERVHFHEIADWDALMDVTAAGSLAAALEGASYSLAPLPLGGGQVKTAHGLLAVPAPATLRILEGFDWVDDGIGGERVTPTGAAILAHVLDGPPEARRPPGRLLATGYGAGTRDLPGIANVLRVTLTESRAADPDYAADDRVLVLVCDVDDMTGEEIAVAADHLRRVEGVLDVTTLALSGKKGRPATRFELLARPEARARCTEAVFAQTSTIGLRWGEMARVVLHRRMDADAGGRPVKVVARPGGRHSAKVESDALADLPTLAERRRAARSD